MARALRIKNAWQEQQLFFARVVVAVGFIVLATGLVVGRLVQLQVVDYDYYSQQSSGNQIRVQPVPPIRGLILDREGRVLAENTPGYQLEVTPEDVPDLEATLARLVRIGILPEDTLDDVRDLIRARRKWDTFVIADRLDEVQLAAFAVQRPWLPGLDVRARLGRAYPYGLVASHALGYVGGISAADQKEIDREAYAGTSHIGKISLERAYEPDLHGTSGHEDVVVNAYGRKMSVLDRTPSRPGRDLVLALDLDAQLVAEQALAGRRGAAVAIDPRNGEVLVFASVPNYDPTVMSAGIGRKAYATLQEDIDRPLFNRALRGQYPPGSTIKPIVGLAGLHFGVRQATDRTWCGGAFSLPGSSHRYRDWKPEGHGYVDLTGSIEQSCDVYYYGLARDLGIERLGTFLQGFGLGAGTGVDIGGEQPGLVPSPAWKKTAFKSRANQVWFPGETVIAGIGQGYLLVTPLQLAHATATIAARGQRFEPRLVKGFRDPATGAIEPVAPIVLPGVDDQEPAHWDAIIKGMHDVMNGSRGTARGVGLAAKVKMAGKSGTAQVFTVGQGAKYNAAQVAERMRDHALFVAFAPLDDPQVAVAVVIENGESGSKVAAPVARAIIEAVLGLDAPAPATPAPAAPGTPATPAAAPPATVTAAVGGAAGGGE
jgi:penicillin-binding protein 2